MFVSSPGQSFLIAVFIDEMIEGTGVSRTAFSALYAAGTVISALAVIGFGRFVDRFGMSAAWIAVSVALAAALGIASAATGAFLVFVALSLMRSFGQGWFPLVGTLMVARSFARRRGRAMAIALFGHTAGGMILPPVVTLLIIGIGWRQAYLVLAAAVLIVALPLTGLVRRVRPAEPIEIQDLEAADRVEPPLRRSRHLRFVEVPSREVALLLFVFATPGLVLTAIAFHAISLLERNGLDTTEAAVALTVMAAANALGTIFGGVAIDRFSTRVVLGIMATALTSGVVILILANAVGAYIAFAILGFAGGVFFVSNGTVWARIYGTERLGRLQGLGFGAIITGAAIGPLPLAVSLSLSGSYVPGLIALASLAAVALTVAVFRRLPSAA